MWQVYRMAAGGSREWSPGIAALSARPESPEWKRWVKMLRWVTPGSRLLPSHRAAMLLSGSPPGVAAIHTYSPELQRHLLTTTQVQQLRRRTIRDRYFQKVQATPDQKGLTGDYRFLCIKTFLQTNIGSPSS
jgi:hypothetical protein